MMDWRDSLSDIFRRRKEPVPGPARGSQEAVCRFLETTVLPAFEELKTEFSKHERDVRIERGPEAVGLIVLDAKGREEFFYAVRAQAYQKMSFAFPQLDFKETPGARPRYRAEVVLRSGPTYFDVTGYTTEQVIRNFLHEYRKWVGWRSGG